jgi:hypothetical protein
LNNKKASENENKSSNNISLSSELEKLAELKRIGILSEDEFVAAKKRLLKVD